MKETLVNQVKTIQEIPDYVIVDKTNSIALVFNRFRHNPVVEAALQGRRTFVQSLELLTGTNAPELHELLPMIVDLEQCIGLMGLEGEVARTVADLRSRTGQVYSDEYGPRDLFKAYMQHAALLDEALGSVRDRVYYLATVQSHG